MDYRLLGRSGVQLSALTLGAMNFGTFANPDHDDCIRIVHAALDAGINCIDTADVYSDGESEEIVGKAIRDRRERVVLATKQFHAVGDDVNAQGSSRRWIMASIEKSLRRLGTDYVDLYQVHRPDDLTDIAETMSALTDVVRQGKARMIGCCTYPAALQVESHWAAEQYGYERFRSNQPPYSILTRGIEWDSLPTSRKYGMGVITWSPLASGWLTGRIRRGAPIPSSPRWDAEINRPRLEGLHGSPGRYRDLLDPTAAETPMNQRKLDAVEQLVSIADDAGLSMVGLALGFVLAHPDVTSAIIGPRTMEQLESQLSVADVRLGDDVLDRIDRVVPPGTNVNPAEAGYQPPSVAQPALRRRKWT